MESSNLKNHTLVKLVFFVVVTLGKVMYIIFRILSVNDFIKFLVKLLLNTSMRYTVELCQRKQCLISNKSSEVTSVQLVLLFIEDAVLEH